MNARRPLASLNQPVNQSTYSATSRKRRKSRMHSGATVGDGIRTTAMVTGATTMFGLLLSSGPVLLTGLAGCFFLMRGCLISASQTALPPAARLPAPSHVSEPKPYQSPRPSLIREGVSERNPAAFDISPTMSSAVMPHTDLAYQSSNLAENQGADPNSLMAGVSPPMGGFYSGNFTPDASAPVIFGFPTSSNSLLGAIAEPAASNSYPTFEISPLFNFQQGRKFAGISQMPGEPSRRVILSVDAIRESGRDITAKLSTLSGPPFSRQYTGLIEKDPQRLKLIPVTHPTSFGMFVTYSPWTSNSPTDISLEISADGKSLSGTSVSGEQFELLPRQPPIAASVPTTLPNVGDESFSFDAADQGGTSWKLISRNASPLRGEEPQLWTFTHINSGGGSFLWTHGGKTLASGTYLENAEAFELDIVLMRGQEPQVYRSVFTVVGAEELRVRVCVPKDASSSRPSQVSDKYGNVFDLIRIGGEARE